MREVFRKVKFCLAIAALIAVQYTPAGASAITFSFSGTLTTNISPSLSGTFSPGQTISGTYTFESTTPDIAPGDPNFGGYPGASTNLSFQVGSYVGSFGGPGFNATNIGLSFGGVDIYQVNIPFTGADVGSATPVQFALDIRDPDETALASDALPLTPPDLALFETRAITLIFDDNSFVVASLDSLQQVPEPSALFLLVVGIAAGVRSLRRRF